MNTIEQFEDDVAGAKFIGGDFETIEDDVLTEIGSYAFGYFSKLSFVSFPNVTVIKQSAFDGTKLTSFYLPNLTSCGYLLFRDVTFPSIVEFPELKSAALGYGTSAFLAYVSGCQLLSLPKFSTPLILNTMYDLLSVYAPSVTSASFSACRKMKTINTGSLLSLFLSDCNMLEEVSLFSPNVGTSFAYSCWMLTEAYLPNAVSIGSNVFQYCYDLRNIRFDSISRVPTFYNPSRAFSSCRSDISIFVPESLVEPMKESYSSVWWSSNIYSTGLYSRYSASFYILSSWNGDTSIHDDNCVIGIVCDNSEISWRSNIIRCGNLSYLSFSNLKTISVIYTGVMLSDCPNLVSISFPLLETISASNNNTRHFLMNTNIKSAYFPKLSNISLGGAFMSGNYIEYFNAPELVSWDGYLFGSCGSKLELYLPKCKVFRGFQYGGLINLSVFVAPEIETLYYFESTKFSGNNGDGLISFSKLKSTYISFMNNCPNLISLVLAYSSIVTVSVSTIWYTNSDIMSKCSPSLKIYVPGELLNGYKSNSYWSHLSSRFHSISELI